MPGATEKPTLPETPPEPAWDVAHLFPAQGQWSEEEYLGLDTNRLVEFSDGRIEVLPMPTTSHQMVVAFLYGRLLAFVTATGLARIFHPSAGFPQSAMALLVIGYGLAHSPLSSRARPSR